MSASVCAFERKAKATDRMHHEPEALPAGAIQVLPISAIADRSFSAVLSDAARHSGLDDHEIAIELGIHPSYLSRLMRAVGQQFMRRIARFMVTTGSIGPAQWLAYQVGYRLVPLEAQQ